MASVSYFLDTCGIEGTSLGKLGTGFSPRPKKPIDMDVWALDGFRYIRLAFTLSINGFQTEPLFFTLDSLSRAAFSFK